MWMNLDQNTVIWMNMAVIVPRPDHRMETTVITPRPEHRQ